MPRHEDLYFDPESSFCLKIKTTDMLLRINKRQHCMLSFIVDAWFIYNRKKKEGRGREEGRGKSEEGEVWANVIKKMMYSNENILMKPITTTQ